MSCASPGATHHLACDCREAAWAEKLAAAEGKGMAWERACEVAVMERDGARKAAQTYHDKLAVAEERARGMGEALREIGKHECRHAKLGDGIDCTRVGMVFPDGFTACPSCIARAALAPPPEAAPSYENFNANLRAAAAASPPITGYTVVNERGEERHVEVAPPEAEKRGEG